jgi:hypothetical protein
MQNKGLKHQRLINKYGFNFKRQKHIEKFLLDSPFIGAYNDKKFVQPMNTYVRPVHSTKYTFLRRKKPSFFIATACWQQRNESRSCGGMYSIPLLTGTIPLRWTDVGCPDQREASPGFSPAKRAREQSPAGSSLANKAANLPELEILQTPTEQFWQCGLVLNPPKDMFSVTIVPLDQGEYRLSQKLLVDFGFDTFAGEN